MQKLTRAKLAEVMTTAPGIVVAYDAAKNLADVQLAVDFSVWDDDNVRSYEAGEILPAIPVQWPRFNGYMVAGVLAVNDTVAVHFCSDAIGEWRVTGQRSQPIDPRRLSIGYPFCSPGLCPDTNPPGDVAARQAGMVIGKEGSDVQIRISGTTIDVGATGATPVSTSSKVDATLNALVVFAAAVNTLCSNLLPATGCTSLQVGALATALTTLNAALAAGVPSGTAMFNAK